MSDPVCLNYVIDQIHPALGDKILGTWEFPEQLVKLPGRVQDLDRCSDRVDYVDIVQIARALSLGTSKTRPLAALAAYRHLGLPTGTELVANDLLNARSMFR
ncbi:hypothetical protein FQZ97_1017430 [compost metagenome]